MRGVVARLFPASCLGGFLSTAAALSAVGRRALWGEEVAWVGDTRLFFLFYLLPAFDFFIFSLFFFFRTDNSDTPSMHACKHQFLPVFLSFCYLS